MERELIITGIGGQGVQLAASVLANAAASEGRGVQLFGSYGGMMRGGDTTATLIVADGPVEAPPTVGSTWSAILMHHEHAQATVERLRSESVVFVNTSILDDIEVAGSVSVPVPATDIGAELGNPLMAAMVMVGAYIAGTALVGVDAAVTAVAQVLPPYRQQLVESNERAIRAGYERTRPAARRLADECTSGCLVSGIVTRGTVVIDVEACKGCDLCIDACPPRVLTMTDLEVNTRGYRYPQLAPGCTGCRACAQICPDFVFQVYKLAEPIELGGEEPS